MSNASKAQTTVPMDEENQEFGMATAVRASFSTAERRQLKRIRTALSKSRLPREMQSRVPPALERKVKEFRANNTDGRGVTERAGRRVHKLLRRVELAIGHADTHADGNVRRAARTFVRSVQNESFDELEQRATVFRGLLQKSGRRRNEHARRKDAWCRRLDDGSEIVEVPTVDRLKSIGRQLDLCVARGDSVGSAYHTRLRTGDSQFYCVFDDGEAQCLIEVDAETNEVSEIDGRSHGEVKFNRRQALDILETLRATADYDKAFAQVGAFSPYFADAPKKRLEIVAKGRRYRIDAFGDQKVVVKELSLKRGKTLGWSLFERTAPGGKVLPEWDDAGCSSLRLGQFATLLQHPEVVAMTKHLFG